MQQYITQIMVLYAPEHVHRYWTNDALQCNLDSTDTSVTTWKRFRKCGWHEFTWHEHRRWGDTAPETELTVTTASPDSLRIRVIATMAAGGSVLCHM